MLTGRNLYGPCPGFQITTFPLTIGYLFCCGITTLTSKVANVVVVTKELKLERTRTMIWKKIIYIHQNHRDIISTSMHFKQIQDTIFCA